MYYAYVVWNEIRDKIYVGQTDNLEKRVRQHNDLEFDKKSFTKRNKGKWVLIYSEKYIARKEAMKRESALKSSRGRDFIRKQVLVKIKKS